MLGMRLRRRDIRPLDRHPLAPSIEEGMCIAVTLCRCPRRSYLGEIQVPVSAEPTIAPREQGPCQPSGMDSAHRCNKLAHTAKHAVDVGGICRRSVTFTVYRRHSSLASTVSLLCRLAVRVSPGVCRSPGTRPAAAGFIGSAGAPSAYSP